MMSKETKAERDRVWRRLDEAAALRPRKRVAVGLRVLPETRDELAARAAEAGTSLTSEIERLLHVAMVFERFAKHPVLNAIHDFNTYGSAEAQYKGIEGDWTQDFECYMRAVRAAIARLLDLAPEWDGERLKLDFDQILLSAQERWLRSHPREKR
jgi:hypothetical protein